MTNCPMFPLNLVVFPGEKLNLHIFENRYRQLIEDLMPALEPLFGIPVYTDQLMEYGTLVSLEKVVRKYDDGRYDISTSGLKVFRLLDLENPAKNKLYAAGIIEIMENIQDGEEGLNQQLRKKMLQLLQLISAEPKFYIPENFNTYDIAHLTGMNLLEKYKLLTLNSEKHRQLYLINHLDQVLPVLQQIEDVKKRILLNGHYKNFNPLNF
ncbi:MAG: LON peptidase substrate-binding domain-containing protein [Cyclobacteriaceae bacterium]|nr:LON peptidase substrate-binding domain-containing protein [Cyclobacteriaceae bacterium]